MVVFCQRARLESFVRTEGFNFLANGIIGSLWHQSPSASRLRRVKRSVRDDLLLNYLAVSRKSMRELNINNESKCSL
jgi:hypothetical protein